METIMNMTFGQILGGTAGIVVLLSVFVEITPIKFNPVSDILNWIGKRTNKGLISEIEEMKKTLGDVVKSQKDMDERITKADIIQCRVRILTFSDELRCGLKHSKESFDQALSDIDDYERYCNTHPNFKNNKTVVAKERILDAYQSCLDKDNFL